MSIYVPYTERRTLLMQLIKDNYPQQKGIVLLFAGFEQERYAFRQESSFYYFTGIEEPASVLMFSTDSSILWVPQYGTSRSRWVSTMTESDKGTLDKMGIADIRHLGHPLVGYSARSQAQEKEYEHLLSELVKAVKQGFALYTLYPTKRSTEQSRLIDLLCRLSPELKDAIVDISPFVGALRRTKSRHELELIYDAVDCTMQAQEAAAVRVAPGIYEYQLQAAVEFVFKESGASPAFPTIVGSGKNSTTLHYTANSNELRSGDLVVIDCGAEVGYYAADITRTYPVSGSFTPRQREIYDIVLETQQYIAELAVPGMWLINNEQPDTSLHHRAVDFLKDRGYEEYFTHAIGHFIGLDVHDIGSERGPLEEGDVITIEPGIYFKEEQLGIRIEDIYWITDGTAVCMSEELPRDSYEIEEIMTASLDEGEEL